MLRSIFPEAEISPRPIFPNAPRATCSGNIIDHFHECPDDHFPQCLKCPEAHFSKLDRIVCSLSAKLSNKCTNMDLSLLGKFVPCTHNQSAVPNILMRLNYFDKNCFGQKVMPKKYWVGLTKKINFLYFNFGIHWGVIYSLLKSTDPRICLSEKRMNHEVI